MQTTWCGTHIHFDKPTIMERLGLAPPSEPELPHPSWEAVWDPENEAYYLWHEPTKTSRWVLEAESASIISDETLERCENLALSSPEDEKNVTVFRRELYNSEDYRKVLGTKKRGAQGKHWKNEHGEFLCDSLWMANKIYMKLAKR